MDPVPEEAIINYTCWQPLYEQINCAFPVKFIEGISKIEDLPQDRKHRILAIDDSMIALSDSEEVSDMYTKYSHHLNYSVIGLTQNLFSKGKHFRTISLNCQYFFLMKSVRDNTAIKVLGSQMGQRDFLHQAYMDAIKKPFGHLFLNLKSSADDKARVRAHIFDKPSVVYLPK